MRVRFQADADLDARIVRGLKRQQPEIDFQTGGQGGLEGLGDPAVLAIAAAAGRILVTHDRRTMPDHFWQFILDRESPGVVVVLKEVSVGVAIEELMLIWSASDAEEWRNRLVWVPL